LGDRTAGGGRSTRAVAASAGGRAPRPHRADV